jgi:preprotein translocase subunit SecF
VLKDLSLVLFVGMAVGAYSSIFIATPLVAALKEREPDMQALAKRVAQRNAGRRTEVVEAGESEPEVALTPAAALSREGVDPGVRVQPKRGGTRASRIGRKG